MISIPRYSPTQSSFAHLHLHLHLSSSSSSLVFGLPSSLIIFIAHLHHYFMHAFQVLIIPAFPFVYSCFLELFFLHLHCLYSYSTLPRPQLLVGLLINASYIANINFPCITAPFAFCASYQTSKCNILLPMPAWMNTNVTTSFRFPLQW